MVEILGANRVLFSARVNAEQMHRTQKKRFAPTRLRAANHRVPRQVSLQALQPREPVPNQSRHLSRHFRDRRWAHCRQSRHRPSLLRNLLKFNRQSSLKLNRIVKRIRKTRRKLKLKLKPSPKPKAARMTRRLQTRTLCTAARQAPSRVARSTSAITALRDF